MLTRSLLHTIDPMLKVLTAAQMREVDRLTTERYGIPSIVLMENAANAVARVITEKLGGSVKGKSILILCGPGNNGGDGAAIGRLLELEGAVVQVQLFGRVADSKGDARTNFEILRSRTPNGYSGRSLWFYERDTNLEDDGFDDWLDGTDFDQADVVVDALFGTGLSRSLDGFFSLLAGTLGNWKREYERPLFVAVDIPSGLNADSGSPLEHNIEAHCTVTFTAPKAGNVVGPAAGFNGELIIADIGSPGRLIEQQDSMLLLAERRDVADWLHASKFSSASYKNKRGHALIVAGSKNYSGAAVLCGDAAMRSGCGLVTLATPESSRESVAARALPEVMVRGVADTPNGAIDVTALDEIGDLIEKADSLAIGCGLFQDESTGRFVRKVIDAGRQPVVVDADALNLLSPFAVPAANGASRAPLILTPHEGEFLRLLGAEDKELLKDRVAAVRDFATTHKVFLVLKGERVLIGHPDGRVVVNPTGNSGLGKAGNGDTLTGILVGFLAQGAKMDIDVFETVVAAVYIAGMAGDVAERKFGKRVMTASDVRECLVDVFAELGA